ncbi:2,3-dehydroadipyl-CoA hydratase [Gordonia sp. TBRC 11910]|uniref:Probable enoyl-CoA hydratase EchA17 n=1 Tax=Gordonia asplenii TaxID=2725283 RepID=A0A848L6N7_9ACTN|nr:enoyl-CoA hydratase-related protein [Gordonia asplenii]NMO04665.1 2,3-dehydroadipyl-CoA hydratase [Gordonia asplenii]
MSPVSTTLDGPVAVITLDRPAARNALNIEVQQGILDALGAIRRDDAVRCVVITGADGVFCAGADITAFDELRAAPVVGDRSASTMFWAELTGFPKPIIAAVEGYALGGGCEIALACDIVIASETARFGVPEVKLGVIPGAGGTQRLIRAVGKSTALMMLFTGDMITAAQALRTGVVADVVGEGEALTAATLIARRIAANSPLAVALAKDAALRSFESSLQQGLAHEQRNFHIALGSADSREGQDAFLGKRRPVFTGR